LPWTVVSLYVRGNGCIEKLMDAVGEYCFTTASPRSAVYTGPAYWHVKLPCTTACVTFGGPAGLAPSVTMLTIVTAPTTEPPYLFGGNMRYCDMYDMFVAPVTGVSGMPDAPANPPNSDVCVTNGAPAYAALVLANVDTLVHAL
jgi:hypothetical protein